MFMLKIGLGKDTHRLVKGRRFVIGGVEIPAERGEMGHSDGDALAHAVCDALLGASALGDIGSLFPSSDKKWKNADSMKLLRSVFDMVQQAGWHLVNIDCVICCEEPKVLPFRDRICQSLARTLEVPVDRIFVKGKTGEGLGPVGKGKSVETMAVCLLERD
jgi:2-C-methyl-D-erythritol 2,4-cyclodiphosphate synthase/2-C-methyl-D-erythritol 4-phosphate cytidylyltransferase/2-C-methyl-D-erythritol 2,4-cyclodiphosphate synthase